MVAELPMEAMLPLPTIQIFGGGRHAGRRIDVQDFLVLCPGASRFAEAVEWTAEIYMAAADVMQRKGHLNGVADEGGLWPDFASNEEGLDRLMEAIRLAGFTPGSEVGIALDIAASSFFENGRYRLGLEGRTLDTDGLIEMLCRWAGAFPILSLEDPVAEDDDEGFVEITRRLGETVQIVGDDYLVSDAASIRRAAERGACNSVLLKVNQCGTVSELIAASAAARRSNWNTIQSGRSGESEDVALSHLAVGLMSDQIKVGSMARSERTAKWNEAIRIEEAVGGRMWRFKVPGRRGGA
jgi:enolase